MLRVRDARDRQWSSVVVAGFQASVAMRRYEAIAAIGAYSACPGVLIEVVCAVQVMTPQE
jgi:hypothetical protein